MTRSGKGDIMRKKVLSLLLVILIIASVFNFSGFSAYAADKFLFGDVNEDGTVDFINDIASINNYISGRITFTEKQKILADVNGDGLVTQTDIDILNAARTNGDFTTLPIYSKLYDYGYCGDTAKFVIYKDGKLKVFGTGSFVNSWSSYNDKILSVTVLEGITSVGVCAFSSCENLKSVSLADSISYLGQQAFQDCKNLKSITLPNGIKEISIYTFENCTNLEYVNVGDGVKKILQTAFKDCTNLKELVLGKSVETINLDSFENCLQLTHLSIPKNVTNLLPGAFINCPSLESISVEEGNPKYNSKNNCNAIIETATNALVLGCKNTSIPQCTTKLEQYAFSGACNLADIIIPSSVSAIGYKSFYKCTGLKNVFYNGSKSDWNSIDIEDVNSCLTNSYIHYNSTGDHNYDSGTITKAANCITKGIKTYKCTVCGKTKEETINTTGIHTYSTTISQDATCTENGIKTYTCTVCGDCYTETIKASGHDFANQIVNPTCITQGYTKHTCRKCGYSYKNTYTDMTNHSYLSKITKQPTCTNKGVMTYTCSVCGDSYTTNIPETGHDFSPSYEYCRNGCGTKNPEYDSMSPTGTISATNNVATSQTVTLSMNDDVGITGYYWGTSSNCYNNTFISTSSSSASKTITSSGTFYFTVKDTIGNLSPTYSITFYKTTFDANGGSVYPEYVITKKGNSFTSPNATKTNYTFAGWATTSSAARGSVSNITPTSNSTYYAIFTHEHFYTSKISKNATCTETGTKTYTCSVCGDSYTETIKATGHNFTDKVVNPTCAVQGYTEHVCGTCGYSYKDSYKNKVSHKYSSKLTKNPSCTVNGIRTYTCSVCGDSYTEIVEASGHSIYAYKVFSPSCAFEGYTVYKCRNCNYSYNGSYTEKTPHSYDGPSYTVKPTCTSNGYNEYACIHCGERHKETLEALGHNYYINKVAPSCTEQGYTEHICIYCNNTYKSQYTGVLGHNFVVTKTKATTSKNGSIVSKCSRCNESSAQVIYYPKTISLSAYGYNYDGKTKKPTVTVKSSNNAVISPSNYTVTYSSGCKNVGRYYVKILFKGNYSGTVTKTFDIRPKTSSISSISAPKKKTVAIKWKSVPSVSGYEVQVSTSSNFSKNTKTYTAKASSKNAQITKNIKSKTKYYIRIRTFKNVKYGGKNIKVYSTWSSAKSVKTKR